MFESMQKFVGVKKLYEDAQLPKYASEGDAGADLFARIEDNGIIILDPREFVAVPTGISLAIPRGFVGLVHPRSGMAFKLGVTVTNAPGTIDSGYRGEVKVSLINHGTVPLIISNGDRIAQLVIQKVETALFGEVEELDSTDRGTGGFGSTGK